jgi:hypothetical protein
MRSLILALAVLLAAPAHALYLTSTDSLEVVLGTSVNVDYTASWADITTTTFLPGKTAGQATTAATQNVLIAAPAASHQIKVINFTLQNTSDPTPTGANVATTITIQQDVSGTNRLMWKGILLAGESLEWTDETGVVRYTSGGIRMESANLTQTTDLQSFVVGTGSVVSGANVWTKPTSFVPSFVEVWCRGAGGGGGGGGSATVSTTIRMGGGGGGGGAFAREVFRAGDVGASEAVFLGQGGQGGGGGPSTAAGVGGLAGGDASFGYPLAFLTAYGGGGGGLGAVAATAAGGGGGGGSGSAGGTAVASAGVGGLPGSSILTGAVGGQGSAGPITNITTHNGEYGAGGGGGHDVTPSFTVAGGSSLYGGGGGGSGACVTAANANFGPSAGGNAGSRTGVYAAGGGGAAGASSATPTAGTAGTDGSSLKGGQGGGGGGAGVNGAAANIAGANGGNGGLCGGGGGGGGAGTVTGVGGNGGKGGDACCWVSTW